MDEEQGRQVFGEDEMQEQQVLGEDEMGEDGVVRGLMGDSIPITSIDPSKDTNITVPEVCVLIRNDWHRKTGIRIMKRI